MYKKWQIDRRTFLRGLGTSIALPMLDIMTPAIANAANGKVQRFVFIYIPNGMATDGGSAPPQYLMNVTADIRNDVSYFSNLANVGGISGSHFAYWNPLMTGAITAGNSNNCDPSTALKTFDQYLAPLNVGAKLETLSMNAYTDDGPYLYKPILANNPSWKGPNQYVETFFKPLDAFNQVFAGASVPTQQIDQRLADQLRRKRNILDYCKDDISKVRKIASKDDLIRMDEYLDGVATLDNNIRAQLEMQPTNPAPATCQSPTGIATSNRDLNYPEHLKMYYDILFFALKCDRTRVSTFLHASENTSMQVKYVPGISQTGSTWHARSHYNTANYSDDSSNPISGDLNANRRDYELLISWHHARAADFVRRLKADITPTGTLFDECMVCWGSDIGESTGHDINNIFWTVAGSANGSFRKGLSSTTRQPLSNLWLSVMKGFGVQINQFGNSTGEISGFRV